MPRLALHRRKRRQGAGFTLVELMTVVLIMGVLAVIGVMLVRGHIEAAKTTRALAGVQAIRVAEEAFRAQNGQYLDCSPESKLWFPTQSDIGKTAYSWRQETADGTSIHPDWPRWKQLGVSFEGGTQYGFMVNAGLPGDVKYPPPLFTKVKPNLPNPPPDLWYVIQFTGDVDEDKRYLHGIATSFSLDVYVEEEDEDNAG